MTNIELIAHTIERYQDAAMPLQTAKRLFTLIQALPPKSRKRYMARLEACLRVEADDNAPLGFVVRA